MPLLKPPQNYVEVDAALPAAVNFGAAERARLVKQSVEVCEKSGVVGSGYIRSCTGPTRGSRTLRLPPLRRGEHDPHVPDPGWHRVRVGRNDRAEGRDED